MSILEEYKLTRQQQEEERKRYRVSSIATNCPTLAISVFLLLHFLLFQDKKKLQDLLLKEKETMYGSKPSPRRTSSFNGKVNGYHANGKGNGFMTPSPHRVSLGSATPELLTPRSYSGRHNGFFKDARRLSAAPLNFGSLSKEDTSSSFASISGSEPDSLC